MFSNVPDLINVLNGPPDCGKSRLLTELSDAMETEENAPPFLYIDGRRASLRTPEEVSRALCSAILSERFQLWLENQSEATRDRIIGNLRGIPTAVQAPQAGYSSDEIKSSKSLLDDVVGIFRKLGGISVTANVPTPVESVGLSAELTSIFEKDKNNLYETLTNMRLLFTALEPLPRKPVLVIDEANNLMAWKEDDPSQLQLSQFFQYLIGISNKKKLVHIVFATSECLFEDWLVGKRFNPHNRELMVLGNLSESEAREYVFGNADGTWLGIINESFVAKEVRDTAETYWKEIYDRCGGNIGLLKLCVNEASLKRSWKVGLDSVMDGYVDAVGSGFEPSVIPVLDVAPLWTAYQWKMVLGRITAAPYYAVIMSELEEELEESMDDAQKARGLSGYQILYSMMEYNLLALCPYDSLSHDLPKDVHGKLLEEVVTLPLPAHVWAAKALLREMDKGKQDKKEEQTSG